MLALFRRSQKVWLWGLLVIVVASFIYWGSQSSNLGAMVRKPQVMGVYDQRQITDIELRNAVVGARIHLRIFEGRKPEEITDPQMLEQSAWLRIIMLAEAKLAGIAVHKEELRSVVQQALWKGQSIDQNVYKRLIWDICGQAIAPNEFERHLMDSIAITKLRQSFGQTILVPNEEVRQMYDAQRTLIKVAYIPFSLSNYFPTIPIGTNEIDTFYAMNEKAFTVPPQVDFIAAVVMPKFAEAKVDPATIEDFYDQNKRMFLVTNKPPASTNDTDDVEDKPLYQPFSAVSNMISAMLLTNEAFSIADDLASRLADLMTTVDAEKAKDKSQLFLDTAKKLGIPVYNSGLIGQRDTVPAISNSSILVATAFALKPGEVSDARSVPDVGQAVVFLNEKNNAYLPALSNIADKVRNEVRLERALFGAYLAASNINAKICAKATSFTNAAAQLRYHAKVTLPFDRATGTDQLGCPPQVLARLFAYPPNTSVVAPYQDGYMIVCPIEVIEPDYGLLNKHEPQIKEQLMYQHHVLLFQMWLNGLQQKKLKDVRSLAQREQTGPAEGEPLPENY